MGRIRRRERARDGERFDPKGWGTKLRVPNFSLAMMERARESRRTCQQCGNVWCERVV
jgi:hypothetical protein